jgi:hypothetical protein
LGSCAGTRLDSNRQTVEVARAKGRCYLDLIVAEGLAPFKHSTGMAVDCLIPKTPVLDPKR